MNFLRKNISKYTFLLSAFASVGVVFSLSNFSYSDGSVREVDQSTRSPLVQYGEYIFLRENCMECHTLRDENESEKRISLDGYGGRTSAYWIYTLFTEPSWIGNGKHPEFRLLTQKTINTFKLHDIFNKNDIYSESEIDSARAIVESQLDSITNYIVERQELSNHEPILSKRTEMVALIAFLQQIPRTKERVEKDRIHQEQQEEQSRIWDEFLVNSDSLISLSVNYPDSIGKGQELFQRYCATCHGQKAEGNIGPNLTDNYWIYANSPRELVEVIGEGSETNKMPEHRSKLHPRQVLTIVTYLKSIEGTNVDGVPPQGEKK